MLSQNEKLFGLEAYTHLYHTASIHSMENLTTPMTGLSLSRVSPLQIHLPLLNPQPFTPQDHAALLNTTSPLRMHKLHVLLGEAKVLSCNAQL